MDAPQSSPIHKATSPNGYWTPKIGDLFQVQFAGDFEFQDNVDLYDLDLYETPVKTINAIHSRGGHVLCYINMGAWEDWSPDAADFPPSIIGNDYEGWPGEKWLDIRQIDLLEPLISTRLDLCREKGFDGVEPDNMDGYQNDTGFSITDVEQLEFNKWLAKEAHARGLAIGLKNDPDQIQHLVHDFDFVILEDCYAEGWCKDAEPFITYDKPVFVIEYTDRTGSLDPYCQSAAKDDYSLILKHRKLDAFRYSCD